MESNMANDISITFAKEEISILLKLLYSGTFIVVPKNEEEDKAINNLVQKVLLSTKMAKAYRGIEFNQSTNEYELTDAAEKAFGDDFDDFVEETFWQELLYRLGQRDLISEIGEKEYRKMSEEELEEKHEMAEEKYREEFDANGIKNLVLLKL
jgi:hypothetical protein